VLLVLKDRVEQADWLDEDEKRRVRADLDEDNQQKVRAYWPITTQK
jgi:hypothetical protein